MKHRTPETVPGAVMSLAARRQGVKPSDITEIMGGRTSDVSKEMRRLEEQGYLSRTVAFKPRRNVVGHCTKKQQADYFKTNKPIPAPSKPKAPKPPARNITYSHPKPKGTAPWPKDTPPHLPYDEAGQPLFKVTIAKPFPQPTRTNTHSGAY